MERSLQQPEAGKICLGWYRYMKHWIKKWTERWYISISSIQWSQKILPHIWHYTISIRQTMQWRICFRVNGHPSLWVRSAMLHWMSIWVLLVCWTESSASYLQTVILWMPMWQSSMVTWQNTEITFRKWRWNPFIKRQKMIFRLQKNLSFSLKMKKKYLSVQWIFLRNYG